MTFGGLCTSVCLYMGGGSSLWGFSFLFLFLSFFFEHPRGAFVKLRPCNFEAHLTLPGSSGQSVEEQKKGVQASLLSISKPPGVCTQVVYWRPWRSLAIAGGLYILGNVSFYLALISVG